MAKQCFVVQTGKSVQVFDAETQDGRRDMLQWVEKQSNSPLSSHEKMMAARIMEGNLSSFSKAIDDGYNLPVIFFGIGLSRWANVILGTFGEPA